MLVALAANFLIDPDGNGMEDKGIETASIRCTSVGFLGIFFFFRIPAVADHTTVGIPQLCAHIVDLLGHLGLVRPDGFYSSMAFAWSEAASIERRISLRIHIGNRVCCVDRYDWIDEEENGKKEEKVKNFDFLNQEMHGLPLGVVRISSSLQPSTLFFGCHHPPSKNI